MGLDMFKEGDFLRHRGKPEWGTGKVVSISGNKIEVRFPHGSVKFRLDIAGTMLDAAEAPASLPGRTQSQKAATTARNFPCSVCGIALNRSRKSADGHWKSCPECSVRDGMEHVFWPYPENFGVSQARISSEDAEGAQSHCSGCRSRGASYGTDRRNCGQFVGMLEA